MPEFDSTITISIILAICALFAPSITAVINNRHQYKIRKLELHHDHAAKKTETLYERKCNTYMALTRAAGQYAVNHTATSFRSELLACIQAAILLCDSSTLPLLLKINGLIECKEQFDESQYLIVLTSLSEALNKELNSLSVKYDVDSK